MPRRRLSAIRLRAEFFSIAMWGFMSRKRKKPKARRRGAAFQQIDSYANWCAKNRPTIRRLTVALTERYTRVILGLRAKDPLFWKGLELVCVGSPAVRERIARLNP
jgi:hypothetical protein